MNRQDLLDLSLEEPETNDSESTIGAWVVVILFCIFCLSACIHVVSIPSN
jgi:hypothetical protein